MVNIVLDFAEKIHNYCLATKGSITSWGRTAKRNHIVGGIPTSPHLTWEAADVVYDDPIPVDERRATAKLMGLQLVVESDHDHLQAHK